MTPPIWLDAAGRPRPTRACWICGREVAPMRFRAEDLRPHGWTPPKILQIPDWCGCTTEYLPVPDGTGWWQMVPIWAPDQAANPLRRHEPAAPPLTAVAIRRRPDFLRLLTPRWTEPMRSPAFGSPIRSYVFAPYQLIKDHRTRSHWVSCACA